MALKGTTKIELTNVKTGQKEVIEKDNLVTNAVPSILGDNPFAWKLKSAYNTAYVSGDMLPLCPNLFGGILLYEDAIPEDVNQLYAQSTNKLVGYSSNNVNDKTDIMRGSMNLNESGELEDGSGYRFVFDFTTAQANGTISSVGLTSKWGGMAGYGSEEFVGTTSPILYGETNNKQGNDTIHLDKDIGYRNLNIISYDENTDMLTSIYVSGQNLITVERFFAGMRTAKLVDSLSLRFDKQSDEIHTIETDLFCGYTYTSGIRRVAFADAGDGYIWGFEHEGNANGNSSGKAIINWIKIKLNDLTVSEGTWEIDAQLLAMGWIVDKNNTYSSYDPASCNVAILDGYLYCINYEKTGLYKINLNNISDISFIEHPDKVIPIYKNVSAGSFVAQYGCANVAKAGNKICLANGFLNGDSITKIKLSTNSPTPSSAYAQTSNPQTDQNEYRYTNATGLRGIQFGVYLLTYSARITQSDGYVYSKIMLMTPYLATINNLPTPVEKTADKTMKITYILREE